MKLDSAYLYCFGGHDAGSLSTIWFEVVENAPERAYPVLFRAEFDESLNGIDAVLWVGSGDADELVELYLEDGDFEFLIPSRPLVHKNSGKKWYPGFKVKRTGDKIVFAYDNISYSQAKKRGLLF